MKLEDLLHNFVLELLRRRFSMADIAQALAHEKVEMMKADEYRAAQQEADKAP